MAHDLRFYASEAQYGRAAVLLLVSADAGAAVAPLLADFLPLLDDLAARQADVLLITNDNPAILPGITEASLPIRKVDGGTFLARCGVGPSEALVLVLDRNQRVALRARPGEPGLAGACLASLDALPREPARDVLMPAPAIVLPNLIPPALCRQLIDLFDSSPSFEGGVARMDALGRPCNVIDHTKKHRRDLLLEPGATPHDTAAAMLLARCAPEIAKAFHARVAYLDRMLVSCYDDTGGWFRRHRDDEAQNVAFREFAVSVNLNTGEYDGGHLLFPEYNDHRYRPPAGAGVIFSTSVLHEAAPITRGRRYVLLTFLHGEAAEQRRHQQLLAERLAGEPEHLPVV
jgi:hypothetical protein